MIVEFEADRAGAGIENEIERAVEICEYVIGRDGADVAGQIG